MKCANGNDNPLICWKNEQRHLPTLAELATCFLCISATEAASERAFSSAGDVIREERNRLKSENCQCSDQVKQCNCCVSGYDIPAYLK